MKAIAVDDEIYMLETLQEAVAESSDIQDVKSFSSCSATLEYVEENHVDIAFLDINMRGIGGLELAKKIMELQPRCKVVFCTGHEEHAVSAFKLHVSGYLMKPITPEAVQKEIDHIKGIKATEKLLTIKCFGNFEALAKGELLSFKRTKTLELLAYLVDRKGAGVTVKQISAVLWEDAGDEEKQRRYVYQLIYDLAHGLESVGAGEVLKKIGTRYALAVEKIDCDYYSYLETGMPNYLGEYMYQYSWSESTHALLEKKSR